MNGNKYNIVYRLVLLTFIITVGAEFKNKKLKKSHYILFEYKNIKCINFKNTVSCVCLLQSKLCTYMD